MADERISADDAHEPLLRDDCPRATAGWTAELLLLCRLAAPCISSYVLTYFNKLVVMLTVGHLGASELGASTLAIMFTNVCGFSICFGISTALDTLASQAVTGAANPRMAGVYLQRALLINTIIAFPLAVLWWQAESLLLWAKQDPLLAHMAGQYTRILLLSLLPNIVQNNLCKFLQVQGLMDPPFYVMLVVLPINALLQWLLVWYEPTRIGFYGAPVASVITDYLMLIGLAGYIVYINGHQFWHPWSRNALKDWGQFIALGVPGIFMICAEWWMFEFASLMAGWFGNKALAAQAVILNTGGMVYMLFLAISVVNSNRIGNFLGAGLPQSARLTAIVSCITAFLIALVNSSVLTAVRHQWGSIFSNDPEVITQVAALLPIYALFQICDGGCAVTGGVLRGCGKQTIGAIVNLVSYYVIGLPLCLLFTFHFKYDLAGIWIGLAIALMVGLAGQGTYLWMGINWEKESICAQQRVNIHGGDPDQEVNNTNTDDDDLLSHVVGIITETEPLLV